MSRPIKFRAWDQKTEQMIGVLKLDFLFESETGIRAEGYCDCNGGIIQNHESHKHEIFPDHLQLMQFTGLHDKNGKEIYEGDISKFTFINEFGSAETRNAVMEFNQAEAQFSFRFEADYDFTLVSPPEIIGNIYETPELLAKQN